MKPFLIASLCLFALLVALQGALPFWALAAPSVQLSQEERDFLQRHAEITLGTDKDWAPYVVISPDGRLSGFDHELLERINALTGAHFQLRMGNWEQLIHLAKARLIDGLSTSAVIESRRSFLNFSNPYLDIHKRVLVPRGNPKHIEQFADLEGKVLVIQQGNESSEKLARTAKASQVLLVNGPRGILDALISGKADVTFDDGTFMYVVQKFGFPFLQVAFSLEDGLQLVFSVRNDWPQAISILNKGLAAIPEQEKAALQRKWFSGKEKSFFRESDLVLTEKEKAYLADISSVPMCIDPNWMPYEALDPEGRHVGLVADFMALLSRRIGKPFELIPTQNWTESLRYAQERKCSILPGAVPTPNRRAFLDFSTPYVSFPLVVATGLDKVYIEDFAAVADQSFAIVKNYAAIELLRRKYPKIRIVEVPDAYAGLSKVREQEVFGYIDTVPSIGYQFQKYGMLDVKISGQITIEYDITVGVRNDAPELLSIINKAIASFSKEERQFILNHWLSVRYEKGFDYSLFWKFAAVIAALLLLVLYRYVIISRYNRQLLAMNAQLDELYKTDRLTGISNRHVLDEELEKELARAVRYETPFSVILLDVDKFKKINDTYGHHTGDRVLQEIARLLASNVRKTDVVGRWGGEEFMIICPQTDLLGATHLAEHLRVMIEQLDFSQIEGEVTASFGVAPYVKNDDGVSLIQRVDGALYGAKDSSRNCVIVAKVDKTPSE